MYLVMIALYVLACLRTYLLMITVLTVGTSLCLCKFALTLTPKGSLVPGGHLFPGPGESPGCKVGRPNPGGEYWVEEEMRAPGFQPRYGGLGAQCFFL